MYNRYYPKQPLEEKINIEKILPTKIKHSTDKICYVCGRAPEQFGEIFRAESLKKIVTQEINNRNQLIQDQIKKYLAQLKMFSSEVKNYQDNLTLNELRNNHQLAAKIAPKYELLAKFAPKSEDNNSNRYGYNRGRLDNTTIASLKKNLNELIKEIEEGNFNNLENVNPDLAKAAKTLVSPNNDSFKPNDTVFSVCKMIKAFDMSGRDVIITEFEDDGVFINYYYKDEYDKEQEKRNKKTPPDFSLLLKDGLFLKKQSKEKDRKLEELDKKDVILVDLTYYLCPICSKLFTDASKAAYREISLMYDD